MNLQILSNTVKEGRVNYTNDFEMTLIQPIDGLNREAYFEVTSVSYPATTKNVKGDNCWFCLQLQYQWFKWNSINAAYEDSEDSNLYIETDKFIVPHGIYTLERLINYLNNALNEYIFFTFDSNGKVKITANVYAEYWLNQFHSSGGLAHDGNNLNDFHLSSASSEKKNKKFLIDIGLNISTKLAFMLGFAKETIQFKQSLDQEELSLTSQLVFADYLPDISDGLDKIFIYCEELERGFVGDTSSEILTSIPIRWSEQGKGNGELIVYSPPVSVKRKFKKTKISSLHIKLKDTEGTLIPFDSGTVSIEGIITRATCGRPSLGFGFIFFFGVPQIGIIASSRQALRN